MAESTSKKVEGIDLRLIADLLRLVSLTDPLPNTIRNNILIFFFINSSWQVCSMNTSQILNGWLQVFARVARWLSSKYQTLAVPVPVLLSFYSVIEVHANVIDIRFRCLSNGVCN